jgi:hypothetical protein
MVSVSLIEVDTQLPEVDQTLSGGLTFWMLAQYCRGIVSVSLSDGLRAHLLDVGPVLSEDGVNLPE